MLVSPRSHGPLTVQVGRQRRHRAQDAVCSEEGEGDDEGERWDSEDDVSGVGGRGGMR